MDKENKFIYDIAVVGAGPAGSIFVKEIAQARPDLKILLAAVHGSIELRENL